MGNLHSQFVVQDKEKIKGTKPTRPDWVLKHAEAMNMPFSQVQRSWRRFIAMGCNNKGILTANSNIWSSDNLFLKLVLQRLSWSKGTKISFQSYLKILKWFSSLDEKSKLKVFFFAINDGHPIDSTPLENLLRSVYPDKEQDEIVHTATAFLTEVDYKKQGFIDEEEFLSFAESIPASKLIEMLQFEIIPSNII